MRSPKLSTVCLMEVFEKLEDNVYSREMGHTLTTSDLLQERNMLIAAEERETKYHRLGKK